MPAIGPLIALPPSLHELGMCARTALRPAIGEAPPRRDREVGDGDTRTRGNPGVDEPVLGAIVERVGEHLFLDAVSLRRMVGEPASCSPHGLARRYDVAMSEAFAHQ